VTRRLPSTRWLALAPAAFLLLFYVWPVAAIVARGLEAGGIDDVLTDRRLQRIAWFTLWQAGASTVLTVLIGLVPALVLARFRFRGRTAVLALVTVPFVLPTVAVGAAFLALLPDSLHRTPTAIVVAHAWINLAVVIRTVGAFAASLDPKLHEAAATLGASGWQTLWRVTLPLLRPAIVASATIVFLFCFTSFGVVRVLGGPTHPTLEVEVWQRTAQNLDLRTASVLALVQLTCVASLSWWWARAQRRGALALRTMNDATGKVRTRAGRAGIVAVAGITAAVAVAPLMMLVVRSLETAPGRWGLGAWRSVADASLGTLWTSVRFGVVATLLAVAIGGTAALAIAAGGRAGRLLDVGLTLPLGTSAVTIGFGLLITFDTPPFDLRGSVAMIPLGHALVAIPFVVRAVLPSLRAIDPGLRDAAATLGAPPWRVLREIDVPLAARSLASGAGFAAAISLGEFGATSFLTRTGRVTAPIEIGRLLARPSAFNLAQAFALSSALTALTVIVVVAVDRLRDRRAPW
jgi:thiamine transport system permease protein